MLYLFPILTQIRLRKLRPKKSCRNAYNCSDGNDFFVKLSSAALDMFFP